MAENRISYVPGTWDLFHVGHLRLLKRARAISKQVTVGVNRDASVVRYKGRRPIVPEKWRAEIVRALACVDYVHMRNYPLTDAKKLVEMGFNTLILGSDWKERIGGLEGLEEAQKIMEVVFLPYTPWTSTSKLLRKIKGERYGYSGKPDR